MALNSLHVFQSYQNFPRIFQELGNKQKDVHISPFLEWIETWLL